MSGNKERKFYRQVIGETGKNRKSTDPTEKKIFRRYESKRIVKRNTQLR